MLVRSGARLGSVTSAWCNPSTDRSRTCCVGAALSRLRTSSSSTLRRARCCRCRRLDFAKAFFTAVHHLFMVSLPSPELPCLSEDLCPTSTSMLGTSQELHGLQGGREMHMRKKCRSGDSRKVQRFDTGRAQYCNGTAHPSS